MITALFILYFSLPVHKIHKETRKEICPGAIYFIVHGHHAPWMKHEKLLCRIGKHDFYGDKK